MDNKHSADLHYLWWMALASIVGLLIYLLSPILTPFLLAGIIACIFNPLLTKIELWRIPRSLGAMPIGNRIELYPVVVIFALLAFGQLFGFVDLLLALPASAVLLIWLRHVHKQYLKSSLYNS